MSKLLHSPQVLSKVIEIFLHQHTKIERVHNFIVHLVCKLLTLFLIVSKLLLTNLPYGIFHVRDICFASFLSDIVTSSLPLKLNILDTPQGKLNT